jgi:hypothetical protein
MGFVVRGFFLSIGGAVSARMSIFIAEPNRLGKGYFGQSDNAEQSHRTRWCGRRKCGHPLNVGLPRDIMWRGKTVHTAICKAPVQGRRLVRRLNIDGESIKHHVPSHSFSADKGSNDAPIHKEPNL